MTIKNFGLWAKAAALWALAVAFAWLSKDGGLAGVLFVGGPLAVYLIVKRKGRKSQTHGSADWATSERIKARGLLGNHGVIVGKLGKRFIRFDEAGHLATFAPTRSGKGRGQIIPTLLTYEGSCFVTDIKRENFDITAEHRRRLGHEVHAINPEARDGETIFNPLDCIRMDEREFATDAAILADLLVPRAKGGVSAHFDNQAYMTIQGLIMYAKHIDPDGASMADVRRLLCAPPETFDETCRAMSECDIAKIQEAGNNLLGLVDKEKSSVLSTARTKTEIWSDAKIAAATSGRSTFDFRDMKDGKMTVYMVIPPEHLPIYESFMRAVVGMANLAMTQNKKRPEKDVLFLLDEFPALGRMEAFEKGIGVVAGYGVKYWLFCQDLAQLRAHYREFADSMLGNCAVRSFFGTTDNATAQTISKALGKATIRTRSESYAVRAGGMVATSNGSSEGEQYRDLMTTDEITAMAYNQQIILISGERPILAEKAFYDKERVFRGKFGKWKE